MCKLKFRRDLSWCLGSRVIGERDVWGRLGEPQWIHRKQRRVVLQSADWLHSSGKIVESGEGGAAWTAPSDCLSYFSQGKRSPRVRGMCCVGGGVDTSFLVKQLSLTAVPGKIRTNYRLMSCKM